MPHTQGHILVVVPNDITRKLIVGILTNRGYEAYEAVNGDEALIFLGKSPVLIILDVDDEAPSIMGFLHKLRMGHSSLPVVAMSDNTDKEALKAMSGELQKAMDDLDDLL